MHFIIINIVCKYLSYRDKLALLSCNKCYLKSVQTENVKHRCAYIQLNQTIYYICKFHEYSANYKPAFIHNQRSVILDCDLLKSAIFVPYIKEQELQLRLETKTKSFLFKKCSSNNYYVLDTDEDYLISPVLVSTTPINGVLYHHSLFSYVSPSSYNQLNCEYVDPQVIQTLQLVQLEFPYDLTFDLSNPKNVSVITKIVWNPKYEYRMWLYKYIYLHIDKTFNNLVSNGYLGSINATKQHQLDIGILCLIKWSNIRVERFSRKYNRWKNTFTSK